jgi:hypothetical protein
MSKIDEQRKLKQDQIKAEMPMYARGQGVWEGMYRHLDPEGKIIDQHKSLLIIRMPDEGTHPVIQTNLYTWDNGRTEKREFKVLYENRRLIYDNELIKGYFTEISEDDQNQTLLGFWRRHGLDHVYFYEMIVRHPAGFRTRTWQWINDTGGVYRRTLVDEKKISDDWRSHAHLLNAA